MNTLTNKQSIEQANRPMNDQTATLAELRSMVDQFREERDWDKYHSPKNLSMAAAVEAAELLEHFQWISEEESRNVKNEPVKKEAIAEEICDVLSYLLGICSQLNIDLAESFEKKMKKNRKKYPVETCRGHYIRPERETPEH